jgi:tRNA-2-methylthio-N6-dimethylallyladenosine synthase
MTGPRKIFVKTFGCQMNVYDSERMTEIMGADGFAETSVMEEADVILLNTCHIREKAAEKVYSDLGRIREVKDARGSAGKETTVAVAGCVAQAEGAEMVRRAPAVDVVVGPQSYHRLGELVGRARSGARQIVETGFPQNDKFATLPARSPLKTVTAFLTVQEGCDKFCTFCVVPYTRGSEYSRPVAQVLDEARHLTDLGAREITLLGQNVNAYRGAGPDGEIWTLARLLHALSRVEGLKRLRYTTSHPRDMSDDLVAAHGEIEALMPYLHLPVQSGSDAVLEAMNRQHTVDEYRRIVDRIRTVRTDIALSSDFIVGFPGESDEDFEATLSLIREIGYAQAYSFKYSKRPGTPASAARKQIPEDVKAARLDALQGLLIQQQRAFNRSCIGRTLSVLFEKPGRQAGQAIGRSPYQQSVHVEGAVDLIGEIRVVKIVDAMSNSLQGAPIGAVAL